MSNTIDRPGFYKFDRSFLYGLAYAITTACLVVISISLKHSLDKTVLHYTQDYICFAIIVFVGALALIVGGSLPVIASVGAVGSLIVLTAFQDPIVRFLTLGAVLFAIGMYGMVVSRNAVRVLMSIELMLNAVNINLVAFARYVDPGDVKGQAFAIFILTVAAAEAAVGLAIVLAIYRNTATVDMDRFNLLKW